MSGAPQRKPQIIVGIVGFKAYLCHCFIKIIAIPLIIRRIAIIFLQCRMCGRLSPPGPVPTLGHVRGMGPQAKRSGRDGAKRMVPEESSHRSEAI